MIDRVRAWSSDKDDDAALLERETALAMLVSNALGDAPDAVKPLLEAALSHGETTRVRLEREIR